MKKDYIESLEKEPDVDLEKEYNEFVISDPVYSKLCNGIVGKAIAQHFYELGSNVGSNVGSKPKIKGWVARDKDGELSFFSVHPTRFADYATKWCVPGACIICHLGFNKSFPDLKWEDEPIEVELIIKRV